MFKVTLTTDGACSGNPGPGGWCAILQCKGREKVLTGHNVFTTNNRMELTAIVEGLKALRSPCEVEVLTDSAYIVNQVNGGYLDKWIANAWRTADGKPVANLSLWDEIARMRKMHVLTFVKVKGHAGHPLNQRADAEAVRQRDIAVGIRLGL